MIYDNPAAFVCFPDELTGGPCGVEAGAGERGASPQMETQGHL